MDIWSWICELPDSVQWSESDSAQIFEIASSSPKLAGNYQSTRTIQLRAERTAGSNSDLLVTFSICLHGFHPNSASKTLWVSDTCPLNSDKPFLPLFLQLLQEIITRSPMAQNSTCPRSQLQKLKPDPISWIMDSHSPESFSSFFNLVFLTRLFWLCVCDAPSEVGSFYFESLLGPNLEALSSEKGPVLRTFLVTVGVDAELCFMRTIGYMLTKWLILKQVGSGLHLLGPLVGQQVRFSYATEAHGFWVLKGYAPILAMNVAKCSGNYKFPVIEARDSVLKYALAHQQLEAVIQLEYSVTFSDGYIRVIARVDNLRFHVAKLGFNRKEDVDYAEERHFVSRARVWAGPEVGATYVVGFSLGRSTDNGEREVEMQRVRKGNFDEESKAPKVKTRAKMATRTRIKNWRWDQDAEGNSVIFDAVLYNDTGYEVATWKMMNNDVSDGSNNNGNSNNSRNRYNWNGHRRPFTKTRGMVFAGDEYGEGVEWRLNKEMEGSVLKWRIGGQVWVSYWPSEVKSSYFETRCVEWCDEVDLPLIPGK
ncbi:hypothetical protein JCGZ_09586 [Jatropha curcas]|uniref:Uncharacterized protein n=1 Tax=Jatropha curcas TaxID=180498 RepID=A0A067LAC1_JATCU|nr:uncharacterized protein LOC105641523 [Jatropha curcas]KDP45337.1 hypothetical protein JCGZ_09586 [Jatropha curcas]